MGPKINEEKLPQKYFITTTAASNGSRMVQEITIGKFQIFIGMPCYKRLSKNLKMLL